MGSGAGASLRARGVGVVGPARISGEGTELNRRRGARSCCRSSSEVERFNWRGGLSNVLLTGAKALPLLRLADTEGRSDEASCCGAIAHNGLATVSLAGAFRLATASAPLASTAEVEASAAGMSWVRGDEGSPAGKLDGRGWMEGGAVSESLVELGRGWSGSAGGGRGS